MRLLADLAVILGGGLTLFNFGYRSLRRNRHRRSVEHARALERENQEMDEILDRLTTPRKEQ